jgi:type IV secretory pathway VirB10-like protein
MEQKLREEEQQGENQPTQPTQPTQPENPSNPDQPTQPDNPAQSDNPTQTTRPDNPTQSVQPENPQQPNVWQREDSPITPGVTSFTRTTIDENGNVSETYATFYEDTGELQVGWTDRLNFRSGFSDLVNSLGDVQRIAGYATDEFKSRFFSTDEQSLETLYSLSRIASRMGFNIATLQRVEFSKMREAVLWLVFER